MKKEEMERIQWQCKGIPPISGRVSLTLQAFVKNQKKDPDGIYCFFLKAFLDSIVELGIIPNDGQKQIGRIVFEPVLIGEERMVIQLFENIE